jgi:hypothetical protein
MKVLDCRAAACCLAAMLTVTACGSSSSAPSPVATSPSASSVLTQEPTGPVSAPDGLEESPPPAGGDALRDYWEVCNLVYRASYAVEMVGRPARVQPVETDRQDGNSVLRLEVAQVVSAPDDTIRAGAQIDVLVGAVDGVRFKGSGVLTVWPGLQGNDERILLFPYPDPVAPWFPTVVRETEQGLQFIPNDCGTTRKFAALSDRAGRKNDIDLLHSLQMEATEETCTVGSAPTDCKGDLTRLAFEIELGEGPKPIDLAEAWRITPPDVRSLAFSDVDPSFLPRLMLIPVVPAYEGNPNGSYLRLTCSLGVGYSWNGALRVLPASACRGEDLVVRWSKSSNPDTASWETIGAVAAKSLDEVNGIELTIDWNEPTPRLTKVRVLEPGEIQNILNITDEQLAELRAQYSQPMNTLPSK